MATIRINKYSRLLNSLKILQSRSAPNRHKIATQVCRCASTKYSSKEYENPDPGPVFLQKEVQKLLKSLTRVDIMKVYRKRKLGEERLKDAKYTFMTDEQLKEALIEAERKASKMLQIPPVLKVKKDRDEILSKDPALQGLDSARFVFTDISFGIRDTERLIVVREPDGTLRKAETIVRDRINQLYFPKPAREMKTPQMFLGNHFESILNRKEYEYILDRACIQFEPNDPEYQRIITIVYQHLNNNNEFDQLRSTRHFGGLVFFLVWNKNIDNLLLDLIEDTHIDEAKDLLMLFGIVNKIQFEAGDDLDLIREYIRKFASKKGALELAVQAFSDILRQSKELEKGIKVAHGHN